MLEIWSSMISTARSCCFLLFLLLVNNVCEISASQECTYMMPRGLHRCHYEQQPIAEQPPSLKQLQRNRSCSNSVVCSKQYNISLIHFPPYSKIMANNLKKMIVHCCPKPCSTTMVTHDMKNISEIDAAILETSTVIFPILARTDVVKLHGFHFLPFLDAPVAFYVIRSHNSSTVVGRLANGVKELWPFMCASLLFALLSGFVAWILDTWINEEEFPRPFLSGLFEGFWWSFISMTTVGYGDKAPKSRCARLFSVLWILLGISIVSLLTATLTNVVSYAENIPSTDMTGKTVGTLMFRNYDAAIVAKHGGIIDPVDYDDVMGGIDHLLQRLFDGIPGSSFDGFLLDKFTYYYYSNNYSQRGDVNLLEKTTYMEMRLHDEQLSYGMLFKHENDFKYFKRYMDDNWLQFDACLELFINNMVSKLTRQHSSAMSSAKTWVFLPIMKYTAGLMLGVCIFGIIYELRRKKYIRVCAQQRPMIKD